MGEMQMVNLDAVQNALNAMPSSFNRAVVQEAFNELVWFRENLQLLREDFEVNEGENICDIVDTMLSNA